MAKHRSYSIEFKRQVAQEYLYSAGPACPIIAALRLVASSPPHDR